MCTIISLFRLRRLPRSTLFPYTTLFRSVPNSHCPHFWRNQVTVLFNPSSNEMVGYHSSSRRALPAVTSFPSKSPGREDRKSTRLNSSHLGISYAVFCLKNKNIKSKDIPP